MTMGKQIYYYNLKIKKETINEILDIIRPMGVGDELGEGYQEGYCDAVDDIVTIIEDYYEQTSTD